MSTPAQSKIEFTAHVIKLSSQIVYIFAVHVIENSSQICGTYEPTIVGSFFVLEIYDFAITSAAGWHTLRRKA